MKKMENKIFFMVIGILALYLLYDGLFPPYGKESYIDKTVALLTKGVGTSPKIINDIQNKIEQVKKKNEVEKRKAVKQGELYYLFGKLKEFIDEKMK